MADELEKARRRLEDEYGQIRRRFDDIHERFDRVVSAGPEDDLRQLLKDLERRVRKVRTGGWLRSGANGHRRALRRYHAARDAARQPPTQRYGG
jgi:hypothetical protein